jgi:hypothetical protein
MAWARRGHYSQAVNESADGRVGGVCERVKAPSQAAQTRAKSCFLFVCLSVYHGFCRFREDSLQAFFFLSFFFVSLSDAIWSASGSGSHATSSVGRRSVSEPTNGGHQHKRKETKDARQKSKEAERGRCGGSRRAHPLCVQVQVQVQVRDQVRQNSCVW